MVVGIIFASFFYARGVRGIVGRVHGFPSWRPKCFVAGVIVLFLALASPIDSIGHMLLWVHMVQHWLLIMIAAPLILLGAPGFPILRGLPKVVRRQALGPFLASPFLRKCFSLLLNPLTGWLAFAIVNWGWHYPAFYGAALESNLIHRFEHISFLAGAMLFWWQIIAPWPWKARWSDAALVVYLLAADVQNTIFSAIVTFSDSVLYSNYLGTSPALGWDPLRDQRMAGAFMWTAGQVVMLPCAVFLIMRALKMVRNKPFVAQDRPSLVAHHTERFDLLRVFGVGSFLRKRAARESIRWTLAVIALILVIDGFFGPSDSPSNLAGTLPWTHWRGVVVIALLFGGNFLCMSCPLMAPRNLMRRWWRPRFRWPNALRSKWLAVGLVAIWLISYEAFDLWSSPMATAFIFVGYFAAILLIDGLFQGGSFCKWVCPIGQFHMTQSLVSPLSVSVRNTAVCATCTGRECIRGSDSGSAKSASVSLSISVPGCELELFQPAKRGNLDCTFCLDCVDACPHDNVGILTQSSSVGLADRRWGSSIGRIASRTDVAALLALLSFGAFANAAGMTGPWLDLVARITTTFNLTSTVVVEAAMTTVAIVIVPVVLLCCVSWISSHISGRPLRESLCLGAHALVPIGASMWCVHWFFHLATSASTAIPVMQRALNDVGLAWFGEPEWAASCCGAVPDWLIPVELLLLQFGFVVSGWMVWRGSTQRTGGRAILPSIWRSIWASIPWWTLAIILLFVGVWIVFQPMEMRGTSTL
ncbi:MAG: cytochrome c oxidase assembly protein [Planctomycetota bacterium]|nr:cytochrome c oxidase assembly protein [Planctomycetota bacterium]